MLKLKNGIYIDFAVHHSSNQPLPDIIRPICLPEPGQIQMDQVVGQNWLNSRFLETQSSKIMSYFDCVKYRDYSLQEEHGITLKT